MYAHKRCTISSFLTPPTGAPPIYDRSRRKSAISCISFHRKNPDLARIPACFVSMSACLGIEEDNRGVFRARNTPCPGTYLPITAPRGDPKGRQPKGASPDEAAGTRGSIATKISGLLQNRRSKKENAVYCTGSPFSCATATNASARYRACFPVIP